MEALSNLLQCNTWWCCASKMLLILLILIRVCFLYSRHKKIDRISQRLHNITVAGIDLLRSPE